MQGKRHREVLLTACIVLTLFCLGVPELRGQEVLNASSSPRPSETAPEVRSLSELIYDLQVQVQTLNSQLIDLRAEQQRTTQEARDLRRELELIRGQAAPVDKAGNLYSKSSMRDLSEQPTSLPVAATPQQETPESRIAKLEENQ